MKLERSQIRAAVEAAVGSQKIVDMHTHLYPPTFGTPVANRTGKVDANGLMLWGVDELVNYHYLVAEVFRVVPSHKLPYEEFWKMTKAEQADHIWQHLFVERSPISESCRGIVTSLSKLGLDPNVKSLAGHREYFAKQDPSEFIDKVMEIAGVEKITMTNAVFDDNERNRWLESDVKDSRFSGVLRIDPLLQDWYGAAKKLKSWDYKVKGDLGKGDVKEARRFLEDWIERVEALYVAVSMPPTFEFPAKKGDNEKAGNKVLEKIILPTCKEFGIPFAMMIGSKRAVNPSLRDAGDMTGYSNISAVTNLCREFPDNRFFVTMLSRENQHELAVAARKFCNLMVFGCWWFLNNPSIIDEVTRFRTELLGTSYIPQHSDARILDQLVYKWDHSRRLIANVLAEKFEDLADAGWAVEKSAIERDVKLMLRDNFLEFIKTK